ncbi:MAG: rane protein [Verrucomicrobiota bacterium]|jgi:membrane protein
MARVKFFRVTVDLFKQTAQEWIDDGAPQLGAALAYYSVFSLAPMILLLLTLVGVLFRHDPAGAWRAITEQMSYFLDKSAIEMVQQIAERAASAKHSALGGAIGIVLALFGATGVFGQLQNSLNTIWGVKAKPGGGVWGFVRSRFLSFALLAGIAFLMMTSLVIEAALKAFSHYLQSVWPGALSVIIPIYLLFDLVVVFAIFALIFKILPNAVTRWRDVWIGALLTAFLFLVGKWALGIYLGSGAAGSAYGAASSLITLLLWIYYSSQILLFGAEFTQVYANVCGADIKPDKYAVRIERFEKEKSAK